MRRRYTGDFETTTDLDDCRVWAWALCEIGDVENFECGNSIESFIDFVEYKLVNPTIYFHNAKFDFQFIISYLLLNGYEHIEDKKDRTDHSFTTLITDTGQFYSLEVYFKVKGHHIKKATFLDSLKILNFKVSFIAEKFDLPIRKLDLDYKTKRPVGHELTQHEKDYIRNDVEIMSRALEIMFNKGLKKMTIGSNALSWYKSMCPNFKSFFPVLDLQVDKEIRKSYKGGFTYLNPIYKETTTGAGLVFDKNSMYPAKMSYERLPVSWPVRFEGKYEDNPTYDLYVQTFTCVFRIKPGKIPSIQIKKSVYFVENEYVESSDNQPVTMTLTKPDLELFMQQYDFWEVEWHGGWKFQSSKALFSDYVNYWSNEKIKAKKDNNAALYQISKLMLNSCYGKFGLNPVCGKKAPYLKDDVVHYRALPLEARDPIYVAVASFITSYARADIITSSQTIRDFTLRKYGFDGYIYSDTDSIHCLVEKSDLDELSKFMEIDDYKLGAWKLESEFKKGKYLRQKCYIEQDYDDHINVTVAGLPKQLGALINFDNFTPGFTTADFPVEEIEKLGAKLSYKYVKGGVVLVDTDFTIK